MEVAPGPAPAPVPAPAPALTPTPTPLLIPTHPAATTIMAQRGEGRNAEADHDHHVVPDTLVGMSRKFCYKQ